MLPCCRTLRSHCLTKQGYVQKINRTCTLLHTSMFSAVAAPTCHHIYITNCKWSWCIAVESCQKWTRPNLLLCVQFPCSCCVCMGPPASSLDSPAPKEEAEEQHWLIRCDCNWPPQWPSRRVSALRLVGCGFHSQPDHTKDCKYTHCFLAWHSVFRVVLGPNHSWVCYRCWHLLPQRWFKCVKYDSIHMDFDFFLFFWLSFYAALW